MPTRKKTWFAILGLLNWQPMSGYDIKKMVEIAFTYFWSESYGQLYPTLNRLVEEGLAKKKLARRHGKRDRYLYSITTRGKQAFETWLLEASELPKIRDEFKLKFFLTARKSSAEGIRLLEEYRQQLVERQDLYRESEEILSLAVERATLPSELAWLALPSTASGAALRGETRHQTLIFLLTLRSGIHNVKAMLSWCDEAITLLQDANPFEEVFDD
jgi:DNA-binding PadR family transcriptional regulator